MNGSATPRNPFIERLLARILRDFNRRPSRNTDEYRFPSQDGAVARAYRNVRSAAGSALRQFGLVPTISENQTAAYAKALAPIIQRTGQFERLYALLEDDASRDLLVALLAFRVLGPGHVRLPLNTARYRETLVELRRNLLRAARTEPMPPLGYLDDYDLSGIGSPIQIRAHFLNIVTTFSLQQYRFQKAGVTIAAREKDVVIDGGACWGDTALYFADRVGPEGRVLSYEFVPDNLRILGGNLARNPALAPRIEVVPRALSDAAGQALHFSGSGPGTRVDGASQGGQSVETDTIDALVARGQVPFVSFIKLDIEGSELAALKGAVRTLETFRPRLAISVYHALDHLWEIPAFLHSLNLGYRFYLEHFTIHSEETVLFAAAD